nr:uncharacterized protein LOC126539087 isoform X2 [Dermacentor andersoni]
MFHLCHLDPSEARSCCSKSRQTTSHSARRNDKQEPQGAARIGDRAGPTKTATYRLTSTPETRRNRPRRPSVPTGRTQYTRHSSNTTGGDINTSMIFTIHLI